MFMMTAAAAAGRRRWRPLGSVLFHCGERFSFLLSDIYGNTRGAICHVKRYTIMRRGERREGEEEGERFI